MIFPAWFEAVVEIAQSSPSQPLSVLPPHSPSGRGVVGRLVATYALPTYEIPSSTIKVAAPTSSIASTVPMPTTLQSLVFNLRRQ